MQALVKTASGVGILELQEVPIPPLASGEVLIRVLACRMCGSDLKFYRASKTGGTSALGLGALSGPVIAGHEPCGVVAAVGSGVTEKEAKGGASVMEHHSAGGGTCKA